MDAATMHVPGFGGMPKKYVTAVAIVGASVVGYMLFRKHSQNASATGTYPAAAGTGTGSSTDTGTGTDSGTGSGYGYGGGGYDPYYGWQQSQASPGIGATPTITESQWVASAASDLEQNTGTSYQTAAAALIKWIAGQQLTAAEVLLVKEAIALDGNPPNGLLPIHQIPAGEPPPAPGPTPGPTPGPSAPPHAPGKPTFSGITSTGATVHWSAAHAGTSPVHHYTIWHRPKKGGPTHQAASTSATYTHISGLPPASAHYVWVNAVDTAGRVSPASAAGSFGTHRR